MGMKEKLKAWKEKRKVKKEANRDLYDVEEERLKKMLKELQPGTSEYKEIQQELKDTNCIRAESRESKRRISKVDKGGILRTALGGVLTLGGILCVAKFEKDGVVYTGEKRTIMDTLIRTAGKFLPFGK